MDELEKLARAVDRAAWVRYDEDAGLLLVWNGSLTVNVYAVGASAFIETDVFTLGAVDHATLDEAKEAIEWFLDDLAAVVR